MTTTTIITTSTMTTTIVIATSTMVTASVVAMPSRGVTHPRPQEDKIANTARDIRRLAAPSVVVIAPSMRCRATTSTSSTTFTTTSTVAISSTIATITIISIVPWPWERIVLMCGLI